MPEHAERLTTPANAQSAINDFIMCDLLVKRWFKPARSSGAAAQQEDHEQHRNGNPEGPQQDVAQLSLLLPTPLHEPFHATSKQLVPCRQQAPCRRRCASSGFPLHWRAQEEVQGGAMTALRVID